MEGEGWTVVKGKSREVTKCCDENTVSKVTGYKKLGESRVYYPLHQWGVQFFTKIARLAQSEAAVYKSRLQTYEIRHIDLLEVAAKNPRESVNFSMAPGGQKYQMRIRSFRVKNKELLAEFSIDHSYQVHCSLYLFPEGIRLEYNTIAIGKFTQEIRHPEALINYLRGMTDRRFHLTFDLGDIVLEELGAHKKLWCSGEHGMWIDEKSLTLISQMNNMSMENPESVVKAAKQVTILEESLMEEKTPVIKSSDLDAGVNVEEFNEEAAKKKDCEREKEPLCSSTRIEDKNEEDELKSDREIKHELLRSLHKTKTPIKVMCDEDIKGIFEKILQVSEKFGDKNKDDPRVLRDLMFMVNALYDVLKQKENHRIDVDEDDEARDKSKSLTMNSLAMNLQKLLEGKEVRDKRREKKEAEDQTDWKNSLCSQGIEDLDHIASAPDRSEESDWTSWA